MNPTKTTVKLYIKLKGKIYNALEIKQAEQGDIYIHDEFNRHISWHRSGEFHFAKPNKSDPKEEYMKQVKLWKDQLPPGQRPKIQDIKEPSQIAFIGLQSTYFSPTQEANTNPNDNDIIIEMNESNQLSISIFVTPSLNIPIKLPTDAQKSEYNLNQFNPNIKIIYY